MPRVPLVEFEAVEEPFEGIADPAVAEVAYCNVLVTVSCEVPDKVGTEADTATDVVDIALRKLRQRCFYRARASRDSRTGTVHTNSAVEADRIALELEETGASAG